MTDDIKQEIENRKQKSEGRELKAHGMKRGTLVPKRFTITKVIIM
jgi:hypothetical protein